jgi:serine/threonine protein kinase
LIERSASDTADEILCPACGKTFRLEGEETRAATPTTGCRHPGPVTIGQTLSHYCTLEPLGGGGMGVVYKAQDSRLGRSVALKFLPQEYALDPQRLERFQREARTISALNHPHVCTIYDIDEYEGQPFLVMELIEGQTLRAHAARRLSLTELVHLVSQVAKALAAVHAAGIVHRDIKPENVMVRSDGYVKVLDFGLARRILTGITRVGEEAAEVTVPGTLIGTVRHMSPEQARGEAVGSESDIFSLGIVFYELATGQHPFQADSQLGVLQAILSQTPLPPARLNPQIPAPVAALIQQMIEKDARLRPTAIEMVAVLAESSDAGSSRSESRPIPDSTRHTVGRQKERAELLRGFESAATAQGLFLCVTGEPGIGKTTVVEDFLAELTNSGCKIALGRGRCSERLAGTEAYLPVLEALESLLHGEAGEAAARIMKAVAPNW